MNNYEYIIASLPNLRIDIDSQDSLNEQDIYEFILDNCSEKDREKINFLLSSYDENQLNKDFYLKALSSRNTFIAEYFNFDLLLKNLKVKHINKALGRDDNQDIFLESRGEIEESEDINKALSQDNLLQKERDIDAIVWKKVEELNCFDYFNLNVVLGFIIKLNIVLRWLKLDKEEGKKLFRQLVEEIRGSFKGVPENISGNIKK